MILVLSLIGVLGAALVVLGWVWGGARRLVGCESAMLLASAGLLLELWRAGLVMLGAPGGLGYGVGAGLVMLGLGACRWVIPAWRQRLEGELSVWCADHGVAMHGWWELRQLQQVVSALGGLSAGEAEVLGVLWRDGELSGAQEVVNAARLARLACAQGL